MSFFSTSAKDRSSMATAPRMLSVVSLLILYLVCGITGALTMGFGNPALAFFMALMAGIFFGLATGRDHAIAEGVSDNSTVGEK
jgi:hypothetical protein